MVLLTDSIIYANLLSNMVIPRLNNKDRKQVARKFVKRVRKDVGYLLKPRPLFLPFKAWVYILSKFLILDNKTLKEICLTSSSKINKTT